MQSSTSNNRFVGFAFIVLGVLFLLPLVTDFDFSFGAWWPLFLLPVGVGSLAKGSMTGGLIVIAVSIVLLLNNLDILNINFWVLWPVALIAIGASILFGSSPLTSCRWNGGCAPRG